MQRFFHITGIPYHFSGVASVWETPKVTYRKKSFEAGKGWLYFGQDLPFWNLVKVNSPKNVLCSNGPFWSCCHQGEFPLFRDLLTGLLPSSKQCPNLWVEKNFSPGTQTFPHMFKIGIFFSRTSCSFWRSVNFHWSIGCSFVDVFFSRSTWVVKGLSGGRKQP